MREVVSGLWQIPLVPREAVNAYLLEDVLVDAGTPGMGKRLPDRLSGRAVTAHAITHAHQDHVRPSRRAPGLLRFSATRRAGQRTPSHMRFATSFDCMVIRQMDRTVTLTEPELAGQWDVEPLEDGRLLLSPHVGPRIEEIEAEHGERLQGEAFERRWGDLPRDGEG